MEDRRVENISSSLCRWGSRSLHSQVCRVCRFCATSDFSILVFICSSWDEREKKGRRKRCSRLTDQIISGLIIGLTLRLKFKKQMKEKVSCDQVLDVTVAADFSDTEALSTGTPGVASHRFTSPERS